MKSSGDTSTPDQAMISSCIAQLLVVFYRFWHGRCHFKGARYLLRKCSNFLPSLQSYPLEVKGVGTVTVDFRDYSGLLWLQHMVGDKLAAYDIEEGLFRALDGLLKEGQIFWDVGANLGTVSAYVVTAFPSVQIFAFEPNPAIFRSINTLFMHQPRVKVYPFALSDEDGDTVLTIPRGKSVGASVEGIEYVLRTANKTEKDVDQVNVQTFKGDSLVEADMNLLPPDVVKIDVEGHEVSVLSGLAKTIAQYRPVIFFEHLYLPDNDVANLVPQGYSLHSVDNRNGELTATFDRSVGHNSVLLPVVSS